MEPKQSFAGKSIEPLFEKIEGLSKLQRMLIFCGVFALLITAVVYFLYLPKYKKIGNLTKDLEKLEKQLATAKRNAANLDNFQAQMEAARVQFKTAMRALPEQKEIPALLTSISKSGQEVGLEFLLFEPKPEKRKEFYAELPVAMNVKGTYHELALFFDKVARLSRIVNIGNIQMAKGKGGSNLSAKCTAVTYRFVDAPKKKKSDKNKKKSKNRNKKK
ncbi:MAG: type 4a pilus biogenesis protein PilO [Desulfobacterales bacterium]|nr:MAG: type 4a pilus biogenesis protein PilO [Desulfobacterales bacterium]